MAKFAIEISPLILDWLQNQIVDKQSNISKLVKAWQSGSKTPTFNELKKLSDTTHIPFGYFFLKAPPDEECPVIHCRTVDSKTLEKPSRELIDTVNMMSNLQEWMSQYKQDNGFEKINFVGRFRYTAKNPETTKETVKKLVESMRLELGISEDWFTKQKNSNESFVYIRKKLADLGVLIMQNAVVGLNTHRHLNINEFRAFTLVNEYAPIIFINATDTKNGKIFSLVHEATHIWLGNDNLYNDDGINSNQVSKEEQICNATAAEILIPTNLLKNYWSEVKQLSPDIIHETARYFRCSSIVVARKALNLNLINKQFYKDFIEQEKTTNVLKRPTKHGGGNLYNTLASRIDTNLLLALDNSIKEGRTQYLEAYRLLKISDKVFQKLVKQLREKAGEIH